MLSDGKPTRTFCYIADAIIGYYKILTKGQAGESYNIGTEKPEIDINELAARVVKTAKELFNYQGKVIYQESSDKEYLVDNPNRRCPIISKASEQLGYIPQITVDEGLKRALIWYKSNSKSEDS